jgi:hypothetical protein
LSKPLELIEDHDCHFLPQFLQGDDERLELFMKLGKIRKTMIVGLDFNFVSQIERGTEMNANLAIKLFIDTILNTINTGDYNLIIMFILPSLLSEDYISQILPYFSREQDEVKSDD